MLVEEITAEQLDSFSDLEHACSVLSLLGCVFIIGSFCVSKAFHRPINRLVFYASFGNLMTNVATLMARAPLSDLSSGACQFQAFLIQMFMPADAFWTLAMAVNVYLTFYHKFDAQALRKMEVVYLLGCYGIPFAVALTYIFVSTPGKGRMYGDATLWCWVSSNWDIWRIATFYGPVWVVILCTMLLYLRCGRDIWKKYKQLREFGSTRHESEMMPAVERIFGNIKTTEVSVTSEKAVKPVGTPGLAGSSSLARRESQAMATSGPKPPTTAAYSVTISTNQRQSLGDSSPMSMVDDADRITVVEDDAAPEQSKGTFNPLRRKAHYEASRATWSYTKCAVLFFTAMLVTWIPSSANRVYSVLHPGQVSLELEYFSAFVLPLQGFWNAAIYTVISWQACKILVLKRLGFLQRHSLEEFEVGADRKQAPKNRNSRLSAFGRNKDPESDSVTELAHRRHVSEGPTSRELERAHSSASKEEV